MTPPGVSGDAASAGGKNPVAVDTRRGGAEDLVGLAELLGRAIDENLRRRGGREAIADLSEQVGVNLTVHAGRWKVVTEGLSSSEPPFWLVTIGKELAGFAWARVCQHSEQGPRLGVVDLLFLAPEWREGPAGKALVDVVAAWFDSEGCSAMDAMALPGDRVGKSILEESGFKARLLVMSREL